MDLKGKDIISLQDLNNKEIKHILKRAQVHEKNLKKGGSNLLGGRILATLFFEPSTRTRLSFDSAMNRLGGRVIGFSDGQMTSTSKGESLSDTIRTVENYCDIIAMRHPVEGSAKLASQVSSVPVINCGDGAHAHPTQTLLDLYTIQREKGKIKGLKVALAGDLKYGRTVHTLSEALARFGAEMTFISPPELKMPEEITTRLEKTYDITINESNDFAAVENLDVLYATRIQKERFPTPEDYEKVRGAYKINSKLLEKSSKDLIVMHPLPRVDEIDSEIDFSPQAKYFKQAYYGVPVRMALLAGVLGAE